MTKDKALKLALEALKKCRDRFFPLDQHERDRDLDWGLVNTAVARCEKALAQPEQEPVAGGTYKEVTHTRNDP